MVKGISLIIYDLLGRQIRKLLDAPMKAGSYSFIWDGINEAGIDVPSGVYFYRLTTIAYSDTKRMILLR
jgi:flagellar hook assembly protein FlgD